MNEFGFDRLIELYKKDQLTQEEKKLVDDWFNSVDTGMDSLLTNADHDRLKDKLLYRIKPSADTPPVDQEDSMLTKAGHWTWLKIAASLLVVSLVGFGAWRLQSNSNDLRTYTSNGTTTKVSLPDGSLVWLKGTSSLEAPSAFAGNTRNVTLQGEALFEVAKDPRHPFIIQCGHATTTVLGTSFNLKSSPDRVELTVLTGKVSFTSAKDAQGKVVLPNEKAIYDEATSVISKETLAVEEKKATTDGTEYEMIFNDISMDAVVRRIEEKFDVTISFGNEDLRKCKIRANFSDQSLENTLDMIGQAVGLHYTISGNTVQLTGEGCR
ncbi:FecR family protein [Chryseolinea serpens]|uniref:FecR family protein n=1 Tax=Chryseolinea serpens TaxID=947013 RepID=A0A1M5P0D0_9BACT|nr:FecR domain-containing protein [Chryseolinea serpens]SHG95276.1 FecR family protein [Chryseolinea serpens]